MDCDGNSKILLQQIHIYVATLSLNRHNTWNFHFAFYCFQNRRRFIKNSCETCVHMCTHLINHRVDVVNKIEDICKG
jgi:hypothetical protein